MGVGQSLMSFTPWVQKTWQTKWGDAQSVAVMTKFKEQADVSHPDNLANGTLN